MAVAIVAVKQENGTFATLPRQKALSLRAPARHAVCCL
jgi:hypothetical protein